MWTPVEYPIPAAGTAHSCLFTGEPLGPRTKEEHTIQRSVGGRIRSTWVSSDAFNEAAGRRVDEDFGGAYDMVFNRLGLLTHSAHKTPKVPAQLSGADGRFEFAPGGVLRRRG